MTLPASRRALLVLSLWAACSASAQTFQPAGGPWTREHTLVGSTPDGRVFARVGSRLGVTADAGRTWSVVSETAAPSRLVAAGEALLGAFPDGVRRSADGGATWTPFGLDGQNVRDVAADGGLAYAVTQQAVYRYDAGWQPVPLPPGNRMFVRVGARGGTLAVGADAPVCSGFYTAEFLVTRDGGSTWSQTQESGGVTGVAVGSEGTVFFATRDVEGCLYRTFPGGLYAQAPGAAVATRIRDGSLGGVALDASGRPVTGIDGLGPGIAPFGVALAGGEVLIGTRAESSCVIDPPCFYQPPSGLYASRNGRAVPVGFEPSRVRALGFVDGHPVVSSDGAVYRLDEGRLTVEAPLGRVHAFTAVPGERGVVLAMSPGPFAPPPPYVGGYGGSYPLSARLGGAAQSGFGDYFFSGTASAVTVGDRIVSASSGSFYSRTRGVFVSDASQGSSRLTLPSDDIRAVGAVGGQTVYAGAADSTWTNPDRVPPARIFRSDDAGDTWVPDDAGLTARNVYAFDVLGTGAARLDVAATSGGVFVRSPGQPWRLDGLAGRTVWTLFTAPAGLLAGTDRGLFVRSASSGTWFRYGAGLDGRDVYAVLAATDAYGTWIGVGTDRGLFETRAFGVTAEAPALPGDSRLAASSRPNPSGGNRTIWIESAPGPVAVGVYDLLGRLVADLGTHEAPAAGLSVAWNASSLPVGVYVVRVRAGAEAVSVRAVVAR